MVNNSKVDIANIKVGANNVGAVINIFAIIDADLRVRSNVVGVENILAIGIAGVKNTLLIGFAVNCLKRIGEISI